MYILHMPLLNPKHSFIIIKYSTREINIWTDKFFHSYVSYEMNIKLLWIQNILIFSLWGSTLTFATIWMDYMYWAFVGIKTLHEQEIFHRILPFSSLMIYLSDLWYASIINTVIVKDFWLHWFFCFIHIPYNIFRTQFFLYDCTFRALEISFRDEVKTKINRTGFH